MMAAAGVQDPHPDHADEVYEPACRSLQELRLSQRRHVLAERTEDKVLLALSKKFKLPLYAGDMTGNMGEHQVRKREKSGPARRQRCLAPFLLPPPPPFAHLLTAVSCAPSQYSDMSVVARLASIQQETAAYFSSVARIEKDLLKCFKDEAHWKDPTVTMGHTAQEINRHREAIKETRGRVDADMAELKDGRKASRRRRASLARVEQLSSLVVDTRGRQKLRMLMRRRSSMNLKE